LQSIVDITGNFGFVSPKLLLLRVFKFCSLYRCPHAKRTQFRAEQAGSAGARGRPPPHSQGPLESGGMQPQKTTCDRKTDRAREPEMRELEVPVLNGAQSRLGLHGLTPEGRFIALQSFKGATVEMG
jgi:hypothetical protein